MDFYFSQKTHCLLALIVFKYEQLLSRYTKRSFITKSELNFMNKMCDSNELLGTMSTTRKGIHIEERPDLSAKLERLKRGLMSDTIPVTKSRQYPSLKSTYGLKSRLFGSADSLRRRSKLLRQAVARYSPPYYFWHRQYINLSRLKPLIEADEPEEKDEKEVPQNLSKELVSCNWCKQLVGSADYDNHKTNRCKNRLEFLGRGYYQCVCCREGFLDKQKARRHVALHFPGDTQLFKPKKGGPKPRKNISIICRDQAKRGKWL